MNALGVMSRAKSILGTKPTPAAVVAWAAPEAAAWRDRLRAAGHVQGSATLARCSACNGRSYLETEDGAGRWCDAPGCRMGYVRTADVAASGCAVCLGDEVMAEVDGKGRRTGLSVPCVCVGQDSVIARRLQSVGVPVKYRGLTLDSWARVQHDAGGLLADARRLADGFMTVDGRPGLLLSGEPGRGKSGLAAGIMAGHVARDMSAAWISWVTWADQLNDLRAAGAPTHEPVRRAAAVSLLVVDDLGAEGTPTDYRKRVLLDLVEQRAKGVTVITTMLGVDDLAEVYGDHLVGRLIELCRPVTVSGGNLRGVPMPAALAWDGEI
jgi:DNA replication protein DnaC